MARGPLGTDEQTTILAALLHDIGKFAQRARVPSPPRYAGFDQTYYGQHGAHAKWSADFVEQYLPLPWRRGAHDVLTHHQARNYSAKAIAIADRLAAAEREDREESEGDPRTAQLITVFARLGRDDIGSLDGLRQTTANLEDSVYPLRPLALDRETLFPRTPQQREPAQAAGDYAALWAGFLSEVAGLRGEDAFSAYLEALLHLLEKYTWCVPSAAYRSRPDVSLFDHSRITAAITACLLAAATPEGEFDALHDTRESKEYSEARFSLLGGDLSGLQRFLYTITSRGAARGLRGRSLYLELLTEAAAHYLLRRLGLPSVNLLYVGGGRFYLLAPLLSGETVALLRREVGAKMLARYRGALYLAIAAVPLGAADFASFDACWKRAGEALGEAKMRRFAELAGDDYTHIFGVFGTGGPVAYVPTNTMLSW